jgi:2-hydroxy-3-keto-5-methylthiopentenyl-1-phosphate phosphatase
MTGLTRQPVVFCDFDGTITENDNIVAIMKHFDPPGWTDIVTRIIDKSMSIQEGVGRMFALLPTSRKEEIVRFAIDKAVIRGGFRELLAWCRERNVPFYVTSGGIDFFVYPLLEPFDIPSSHIFCNTGDFSGETIRIDWPHPCDERCENGQCGMCKTKIIRRFPETDYFRILIGDSVTDFAGAKLVDCIFARSHLAEECDKLDMAYYPYENFHTIVSQLNSMFPVKEAPAH